jgi:hypothetical protein
MRHIGRLRGQEVRRAKKSAYSQVDRTRFGILRKQNSWNLGKLESVDAGRAKEFPNSQVGSGQDSAYSEVERLRGQKSRHMGRSRGKLHQVIRLAFLTLSGKADTESHNQ